MPGEAISFCMSVRIYGVGGFLAFWWLLRYLSLDTDNLTTIALYMFYEFLIRPRQAVVHSMVLSKLSGPVLYRVSGAVTRNGCSTFQFFTGHSEGEGRNLARGS
jgi:hypothetical protein